MTVSVSRPERSTVPGVAPVALPSRRSAVPFTSTRTTPTRAGGEARGVAGQVARPAWRPRSRRCSGSNTTRSAIAALAEHAAVAQAEQLGRRLGDELHRPLERARAAAAEAVAEEAGGVGRAAHAVEVGAGVGAAEHGAAGRPTPRRRSSQRRAVVVLRHRPQHRAQVVGDHDVEQRVEGSTCRARRRCRRRPGRGSPSFSAE